MTASTNFTPAILFFLISLYDFKFPAELKAMQHIFLRKLHHKVLVLYSNLLLIQINKGDRSSGLMKQKIAPTPNWKFINIGSADKNK
jgi:hypothetical protein